MLQELGDKLDGVLRKLKGHGKLTEKNIADSMRDIRRALLEADVNYKVAKQFINDVEQRALGQEVIKSITPGQMVVKIIHDELAKLMGEKDVPVNFGNALPGVLMLCGLQGSGKTTLAGKLAFHFRKKGRNPLLVAADIYRPAAIDQLKLVGNAINVPVHAEDIQDALTIAKNGIDYARKHMMDTVIIDTAGRLHIDEKMMQEVKNIKNTVKPSEILFVADAMTGQDAVKSAKAFAEYLDFDGVVLTKMDGDARGGAALSIRAVTNKPIKFISTGEKVEQLETFHPDRIASRILGMGDVVSLVERAQETIDQEKAATLEKRLRRQEFTLEDFFDQLQQIKKMGPLQDILSMIPGAQNKALKNLNVDEGALVRVEAIINSMTTDERRSPHIINGSRRKRIARGSGTSVQEVNRLLNQFTMMRKMMKQMNRGGGRMRMPLGF
ncbi:signal recognition particle protein [candidate division KSB1 bacterium]|nr:signal recognition particle protein [candidate division KSB1 bacterium]RQW04717.1 MAG: signal recognition particle protein [candidate division KSB1 bacterium]